MIFLQSQQRLPPEFSISAATIRRVIQSDSAPSDGPEYDIDITKRLHFTFAQQERDQLSRCNRPVNDFLRKELDKRSIDHNPNIKMMSEFRAITWFFGKRERLNYLRVVDMKTKAFASHIAY